MTIINVWWILKINTLIKQYFTFHFRYHILFVYFFPLNVVLKFVSILYVIYNILFRKNTFCLYLSQKMLFKTVELFQSNLCYTKKRIRFFSFSPLHFFCKTFSEKSKTLQNFHGKNEWKIAKAKKEKKMNNTIYFFSFLKLWRKKNMKKKTRKTSLLKKELKK